MIEFAMETTKLTEHIDPPLHLGAVNYITAAMVTPKLQWELLLEAVSRETRVYTGVKSDTPQWYTVLYTTVSKPMMKYTCTYNLRSIMF